MARRKRQRPVIPAECHSDDHKVRARFDALPWFAQASDEDIRELAGCNWGGDYPADGVAQFLSGRHRRVARVFRYLSYRPTFAYSGDRVGFECHVSGPAALRWLREHRPALYESLRGDPEGAAEEGPNPEGP
jgi:hypothetical protein